VCGNLCIADGTCCTAADCLPLPAGTTATTCPGPGDACTLTCNSTCFDINKTFSDGCECCEDANTTCGGNNLGTLGVGNTATGTGKLPGSEADWFTVTFTGNATVTFHPAISLTADPGVVFDIYTSCAGGSLTCGNEGGNCTGKTSWETSYTCQGATPSCTTANNNNFQQIPVGTVYVKVYRATGASTCNPFTLSISN
jgi:hypothetical protein